MIRAHIQSGHLKERQVESSPGKEVYLEFFVRRVGTICEEAQENSCLAERSEGTRHSGRAVGWHSFSACTVNSTR
jgi:hypothetical protein